jgi:hypothetical protein
VRDAVKAEPARSCGRRQTTAEEHANVLLLKRLDLGNIAAADLFVPDVLWQFFNPGFPMSEATILK